MEITKNNLHQAIAALRQCAKENKGKQTDTGCIVVSDLCLDVADYLEKTAPSVWHDISKEANLSEFVLLYDEKDGYMSPPSRFPFKDMLGFVDAMNRKYGAHYTKWAYKDDLLMQ